jgi:hypothetical protein
MAPAGLGGCADVVSNPFGRMAMRRRMLGSVAVWLAGGAVLAGDGPKVQVPGLLPDGPSPATFPAVYAPPGGLPTGQVLVPIAAWQGGENKGDFGPATRSLQPLVTVAAQTAEPLPKAPTPLQPPATLVSPSEPLVAMDGAVDNGHAAPEYEYDTGRWFGSVDYLLFWVRRNPTPPLVQVLPANLGDFRVNGGNLPPNSTISLFGLNGIDPKELSGARVQLGAWLVDRCWGVDASYMQLFQKTESFSIASQGIPVIGRGFVDAGANATSFLRLSTPDGTTAGNINAASPVELYTFDANLRRQGCSVFTDRVDYLLGLRYLQLRDSVTVDSGATITDPTGANPPFKITSNESFHSTNQFYGSQIGFDAHSRYGCFDFEFMGKFAAGWVHQEVTIAGVATTQSGNGPVDVFPNESILYVQRTNAGTYSRDRFAVVPEILFKLGYQISQNVRASVGYNLLTVSSVERSGAAIDPAVNPSLTRFIQPRQNSNVPQPVFLFGGTDFWAQGLTFGLTVTY